MNKLLKLIDSFSFEEKVTIMKRINSHPEIGKLDLGNKEWREDCGRYMTVETSSYMNDEWVQALCKALINNTNIDLINLDGNFEIYDEGIKAIAHLLKVNKTIHHLSLNDIKISYEGFFELSEALKVNNTLKLLNLDNTECDDKAVKLLSDALSVNTKLISLSLRRNNIGNEGIEALKQTREKRDPLLSFILKQE